MFKNKQTKSAEFGNVNIQCRIYIPNSKRQLLNKYFGHNRYIYNWAVQYNQDLYKSEKRSLNFVDLAKQLPKLKQEHPFLTEVDSTTLQQSLRDYYQTYQKFLQRKGGYPHFRNKKNKQSCRIINVSNSVRLEDNKIRLGKFGWVKIKPNHSIPMGRILNATIKCTKTDKLFVTICIERAIPVTPMLKTGKEIGIDIGVSDFAHFSNGQIISKPDFFEFDDKKLRRLHRSLSRKEKGSANRNKARRKLAIASEKDRNRRTDFTNKLSYQIVKDYDIIAMEHLNIKQMMQNPTYRNLHKAIGELGWYELISKIKYKADWYGKQFVQVDTLFPSSQLCSTCRYQNPIVKNLSVRKWECPICHTVHDRDFNAANNILTEGKRLLAV